MISIRTSFFLTEFSCVTNVFIIKQSKDNFSAPNLALQFLIVRHARKKRKKYAFKV